MIKKGRLFSVCLVVALCVSLFSGNLAFAQDTNKAWSVETFWIFYTGTIQFVPSFVVPANPGYYLEQGKNVKQAYVDYTRDGVSVTTNGGKLFTLLATSKTSNTLYSAVAHAWDSLNPWAPKTLFHYGWFYF